MRLHIDPTACQAYGLCQERAPRLVELDEWGYAVPAPADVPADAEHEARSAAAACPNGALRLATA
jgi:ferredoxin